MNKSAKRIVPFTALALLLISIAPMAGASTLTVDLNPQTQTAKVNSVSTTSIVFTYPSGSAVSKYLENVSSSVNYNSSRAGATGARQLQGSFDDEDSRVAVQNMTVSLDYKAKGNATALVITKVTNITAWVSGVFRVVNGTVHADLGWRSFVVQGAMNLDMGDHVIDVNMVGSTVQDSLATHTLAVAFLLNAFGGSSVWDRPTLNFTSLNTPLSTWTKYYDPATNTTTFSKTISGESNFSASFETNGQRYSLSAVSDPSGVIAVQGYANVQGNSLVIAPALQPSMGVLAAGAALVVVAAAAAGYLFYRTKARAKPRTGEPAPI